MFFISHSGSYTLHGIMFDAKQSSIFTSGFQFDYVFDWTILKYQQSQLANPPSRALVSLTLLGDCLLCSSCYNHAQ